MQPCFIYLFMHIMIVFNLLGTITIMIASLARDVALYDHDHAAQHCSTAIGWVYPNASMV